MRLSSFRDAACPAALHITGRSGISLADEFGGPTPDPRRQQRSATMVLKGFSYAMIGAFMCGLAMTVAGSAGVLLGL